MPMKTEEEVRRAKDLFLYMLTQGLECMPPMVAMAFGGSFTALLWMLGEENPQMTGGPMTPSFDKCLAHMEAFKKSVEEEAAKKHN
jgi:hypothetical protein